MTEKHVCTNESCPDDLHKATTGGTAVPDDRLERMIEEGNRS